MTATTRISLRDAREAATRALIAHGASHGEAGTAAAMVLDAELVDGVGLATLVDDLAREPWSRTPVEVTSMPGPRNGGAADHPAHLVLGSPTVNRLLREAPLAVELIVGEGDLRAVGVPCAVSASSLLDAVTREVARNSGQTVTVLLCTATEPGSGDPGRDIPKQRGQLRLATPDGDLGISPLIPVHPLWEELVGGSGVLALRDVDWSDDLEWHWVSAEGRAQARARVAEQGLSVETSVWRQVYDASRRYLVPS